MCVKGDVEVTQKDDPPFLKVAGCDEVDEAVPLSESGWGGWVRFHVCADNCGTSEGCAYVKRVPPLVLIVARFAHPSVEPTFVEEGDNSPTFPLMATVRREDEVGKGCRVNGRDVVL